MPRRTLLQPKLIHNQLVPSQSKLCILYGLPHNQFYIVLRHVRGEGNIQHPVPIMNDCAQGTKRNRKDDTGQMGY